jgi:WXG100 family type VII secretion target
MAATTSVDIQGMTQAQGNFQNALSQVKAAYNSMESQSETLTSNWGGDAASAFLAALTQWLQDLNTVQTQLSNMLETLISNTGVYSSTSDTTNSAAASFGSSVGNVAGLGI